MNRHGAARPARPTLNSGLFACVPGGEDWGEDGVGGGSIMQSGAAGHFLQSPAIASCLHHEHRVPRRIPRCSQASIAPPPMFAYLLALISIYLLACFYLLIFLDYKLLNPAPAPSPLPPPVRPRAAVQGLQGGWLAALPDQRHQGELPLLVHMDGRVPPQADGHVRCGMPAHVPLH